MGKCSIENCDKEIKYKAKQWCGMHYQRWRNNGDPIVTKGAPKGALLEFVKAAAKSNTDECIIWPDGWSLKEGYGNITFAGRMEGAHRVALHLATGVPLDDPRDAAHGPCHNRRCVNPWHLSWQSRAENMADKVRDKTLNQGESHGLAKLSESAILAIRTDPRRPFELAPVYNISEATIRDIRKRKSWRHIE